MQSAKCMLCGSDAVPFRWTTLMLDGSSLVEIDFSRYCLRCGELRLRTLREVHSEKPARFALFLLPEEKAVI